MNPSINSKYKKEIQLLEEMNLLFQPRWYWGSPEIWSNKLDFELLNALVILKKNNLIKIEKEDTKNVRQSHAFDYIKYEEKDEPFYFMADKRRGHRDLKDETWSSYLYLKNKFPDGEIIGHFNKVPYFYEEAKSKTIILAGNVTPTVILKIIIINELQRLCIIGKKQSPSQYPEDTDFDDSDFDYKKPNLEVTTFEFSNESIEEIKKLLSQSLQEDLDIERKAKDFFETLS